MSNRRAANWRRRRASIAKWLASLLALGLAFFILAALSGAVKWWVGLLAAVGLVLLGVKAQNATEDELSLAISNSDLESIPRPETIPEPVTSVWDVLPLTDGISALRSPDGRVTVVKGWRWQESRDSDGEVFHAVNAVAYAIGLPNTWRASANTLNSVVFLPDPATGDAAQDVVAATLRDTRTRATVTLQDGWLVCTSGLTGLAVVRLAKMTELLIHRLESLDRTD
jgi:hypothetical protein